MVEGVIAVGRLMREHSWEVNMILVFSKFFLLMMTYVRHPMASNFKKATRL